MNIRNTTADMRDPANRLLLFAEAMTTGTSAPIERMEADGQRQLVNSDLLPTDMRGGRSAFEALGFTFGNTDPSDPMFAPATLPAGWKRGGSDHNMWSYLVDDVGRRRVSIFYKAAFYDRSAHMDLNTVYGYVRQQLWDEKPIVTDDSWATTATVQKALGEYVAERAERVEQYSKHGNDPYWAERVEEIKAEIAVAEARLAEFDGDR